MSAQIGMTGLSDLVGRSSTIQHAKISDPRLDGVPEEEAVECYDVQRSGCQLSTTNDPFGKISVRRDRKILTRLNHLGSPIGEGQLPIRGRDPGLVSDEGEIGVDPKGETVSLRCTQLDLEAIVGISRIGRLIETGKLKLTEIARNVVTGVVEWIAEFEADVALALGLVNVQLLLSFESSGPELDAEYD